MCIGSTIFIFVLALVGVFYPYNRGALFTALVVIYALTAGIAGYTAASFFCQLEGTNWVSDHEFLSHCLLHTSLSLLGMPLKLVITVSPRVFGFKFSNMHIGILNVYSECVWF
jgi:hypothetical protein